MKALKMSHEPHETHHTFIYRAKESGLDEYCLKLIVGHAIADLTERVYTHRQIEQLKHKINKTKRKRGSPWGWTSSLVPFIFYKQENRYIMGRFCKQKIISLA